MKLNSGLFIFALLLAAALISGCTNQDINTNALEQTENITIEKQTFIFNSLYSIGVENSFVDITKQRVLVRFILPKDLEKEKIYYFIFGLAAKTSSESQNIEIETYDGDQKTETVYVKMSDVLDLLNRKTTLDKFQLKIIYAN